MDLRLFPGCSALDLHPKMSCTCYIGEAKLRTFQALSRVAPVGPELPVTFEAILKWVLVDEYAFGEAVRLAE